jgi:hypothetical protein
MGCDGVKEAGRWDRGKIRVVGGGSVECGGMTPLCPRQGNGSGGVGKGICGSLIGRGNCVDGVGRLGLSLWRSGSAGWESGDMSPHSKVLACLVGLGAVAAAESGEIE